MTDKITVRLVVGGLVVLALAAVICTTVLISQGHDAALVGGVATGAVGALAGILASTRTGPDPAVETAVEQANAAGAAQKQAEGLEALIDEASKSSSPRRATSRKGNT
jgi:hypothetical protein